MNALETLDLSLFELETLRASSYHRLPQWIINKKAVRNIKNQDQECFKWAAIAGLNKPTNPNNPCNVSSYSTYEELYDWSMLTFPVALKYIKKFEERNNVIVNVYGCTNYPCNKPDESLNEDNNIGVDSMEDDTRSESEILRDNDVCEELLEELQCSSDDEEDYMDEEDKSKKPNNRIHPLKVSKKVIQSCDENGDLIEN